MNDIQTYTVLNSFINKAFRDSMLTIDKEENYYNVASIYHEVMSFLIKIRYSNTQLSEQQIKFLRENNRRLKFILNEFEKNYYLNWIQNGDFKIIQKSAAHYDRKLNCYYRKFNFNINSHKDPFTEDEKEYCLSFNQDVFPELNYKKFEDIEISKIKMSLSNLLSN